jgi:hypothetical protein
MVTELHQVVTPAAGRHDGGVKADHPPVQQEAVKFADFHEIQLLRGGWLMPLKIPHDLEKALIILYPSPSVDPP